MKTNKEHLVSSPIDAATMRRLSREAAAFEKIKSYRAEAERAMDQAPGNVVLKLSDDDVVVRQSAARRIAEVGDQTAVGPLVERLEKEGEEPSERDVRVLSVVALGTLADRGVSNIGDAVEPLITFMRADYAKEVNLYNDYVEAVQALGKIGDDRAIASICEMIEEELTNREYTYFLEPAVIALGEIGGSSAIPTLQKVDATRFPGGYNLAGVHRLAKQAIAKCKSH